MGRGLTVARGLAAGACALALAGPARGQAPPAPLPPPPTIYLMEQLRTPPLTPEVQAELQPIETMGEAEGVLKAHRISFAWAIGEVRSASMPPAIAVQIERLRLQEVFVAALPQGAIVGRVLSKRPEPPAPPPPAPTPAPR